MNRKVQYVARHIKINTFIKQSISNNRKYISKQKPMYIKNKICKKCLLNIMKHFKYMIQYPTFFLHLISIKYQLNYLLKVNIYSKIHKYRQITKNFLGG